VLDLIQFTFALFTNPVEAIGTIVILGLIIVGLKWSANRSKFNVPLDAAPEVILRHRLIFMDDDLEQNRSATISPKQIKRIRNEFLMLLIAYMALLVFMGFIFDTIFGEDIFSWDLDLISIGLQGFMGLAFLVLIGIAVFQLWGYIKDLKTKRAIALLSALDFEEHEAEHMGFKFQTHQYNIIAHDSRLPEPLPLHIGFMSEDMWVQVQKLRHQTAILYIAPNTSKLLSFELVALKLDISQKDVN
jgi:hypothetical protein